MLLSDEYQMAEGLRSIHPDLRSHPFSFDDVNLPPVKIPDFELSTVVTSAKVTSRTILYRPMIGSPMDTVTEYKMAIALAKQGGIGTIHVNLPIDRQAAEVRKVKRWESGFVIDPEVLGPNATIEDVFRGEQQFGFSSYPITADGTLDTEIIGIITARDIRKYRRQEQWNTLVTVAMTPSQKLIFAEAANTLDKKDVRPANALLDEHGLDVIPVLTPDKKVAALVTWSDIKKNKDFPLATKGDNHQLKVWAAVEPRPEKARDRIDALVAAKVDGIVIDSRNIYGGYDTIARYAKSLNPELDVIVGNIVHPRVLELVLEQAGDVVDAFRIGIGTGEICITTEGIKMGRGLGTAALDINEAYLRLNAHEKYGYKGFIPDGGMKSPGHFVVGAALMRNFGGIMMGSWLGRFDEAPSEKMQIKEGVFVKRVRGMASPEAFSEREGGARYGVDKTAIQTRFAEGVGINVPAVGEAEPEIIRFFGGVAQGIHGLGARNLKELYEDAVLERTARAISKGSLSL